MTKRTPALILLISMLLIFPSPLYETENTKVIQTNTATHVIEEPRTTVSIESHDRINVTCALATKPQEETISIDIPTNTYSKTYEDGKFITDSTSPAYQTLSQCYVSDKGHYMYEDYYAVALGNYFDDVGSKYIVTLDNGQQFKIIKCDVKQDQHTTNRMIDSAGAMVEFIIDENRAAQYYGRGSNGYILDGSFNNCETFNGCIASIEQVKE